MIKISGLWLHESAKTGEKYLSGSWGRVKILIFKNKYYNDDKTQPVYIMYLDHRTTKGESS